MLRKIVIFCVVCFHVSHGTILTIDESRRAFLNLQIKMEFAISITREDVNGELNKLNDLLDHFKHRINMRSNSIRGLVYQKNTEAFLSNKTIDHCIKGLRLLSKNLDLYNLKRCTIVSCHIQETLVEAKKMSLEMSNRKHYCYTYLKFNPKKLQPCLQRAVSYSEMKQKQIFRKLHVVRRHALSNGLRCLQDNFNTIIRELCLLTCTFEECVLRRCAPSQGNPWAFDTYLTDFRK